MKDLHMFNYWADKKGLKDAVKDYYPDTLAKDPVISMALAQIELSELAIQARVADLQTQYPYQD